MRNPPIHRMTRGFAVRMAIFRAAVRYGLSGTEAREIARHGKRLYQQGNSAARAIARAIARARARANTEGWPPLPTVA